MVSLKVEIEEDFVLTQTSSKISITVYRFLSTGIYSSNILSKTHSYNEAINLNIKLFKFLVNLNIA